MANRSGGPHSLPPSHLCNLRMACIGLRRHRKAVNIGGSGTLWSLREFRSQVPKAASLTDVGVCTRNVKPYATESEVIQTACPSALMRILS